jgi:hypothetical protein
MILLAIDGDQFIGLSRDHESLLDHVISSLVLLLFLMKPGLSLKSNFVGAVWVCIYEFYFLFTRGESFPTTLRINRMMNAEIVFYR